MIEWSVYSHCLSLTSIICLLVCLEASLIKLAKALSVIQTIFHSTPQHHFYSVALPLEENGKKKFKCALFLSCQPAKGNGLAQSCLRYEVTIAIYCKSSTPLYHVF